MEKTLYFNVFDVVINKAENYTTIGSAAWVMQNDQLHIRFKEQQYSPDFDKKLRTVSECILSRQ